MKNRISTILTAAVVTGLMASQFAQAEDKTAEGQGDKMATEKNSCKGKKVEDKNSCKGQKDMKAKKTDKNSCKNGCSEAKKKDAAKKEDTKG